MIEADYYSAPDCSVVCPNGGTAKANGTQDCNCNLTTTTTLVSSQLRDIYGYISGYLGSLKPDTYRGIKITSFYSGDFLYGKSARLYFEKTDNIPDTLKIKISGIVYDFVKTTSTQTGKLQIYWKYSGAIFEKDKAYTIEFLN